MYKIQANQSGTRSIEVSDQHLETTDKYQLLRNLVDSNGIIDEEVLKLVETAHTEAWNVINENRDILDELVRQLLVKETLNEKELAAIFANIKKAPKREVWLSDEKRPDSDIPPVPIPDKLKKSAGLTN